jgi:hypothetical protein
VLGVIGTMVQRTVIITTPQGAPVPPPPSQDFFSNVVLPVLPWFLIFGFIWFVFFRMVRNQPRRAYDAQPYFHRTQNLELLDHGLLIYDSTAKHELQWSHFTRCVESLNLMMLYIGGLSFYIVPKRAFTSPEGLNEFRRRVQESVADWKSLSLPSAFPVVPIAPTEQPPPLPRV